MRLVARYLLVLSFVVAGVQCGLRAQTPTKTDATPGAIISGKVTVKGKPAVGAVVIVQRSSGLQFSSPPRGITDRQGVYRITNVQPGEYQVVPLFLAYVASGLSNNAWGKKVVVTSSENIENVDFSLSRGRVITGKITEADGRPAIEQEVSLFRAQDFDARPEQRPQQVYRISSVTTDDRGIYRMFGLNPGKYKVGIGPAHGEFSAHRKTGRGVFRVVMYPDVTDPAKATVVEVTEGSEASNIDITLGPSIQTFSASGSVIDTGSGKPVPFFDFTLQRTPVYMGVGLQRLVSDRNGEFVAEDLIPGRYRATAVSKPGQQWLADSVGFEITDQNLTGVTINVDQGATISGVLAIENENPSAFSSQMDLYAAILSPARSESGGESRSMAQSRINSDGSFSLSGLLPGKVSLGLLTKGELRQRGRTIVISRIERNGVVQPNNFDVGEREQITGLRVVASFATSTLRGSVVIQNGTLPPDGAIFIRVTSQSDPTKSTNQRADSRGHFIIQNQYCPVRCPIVVTG